MVRSMMLVVFTLSFVGLVANAAVIQHTFHIGSTSTNLLCRSTRIIAVNNQMPGPTLVAHEGDTIIIHVINNSPHDISIHWHGIFQLLSGWADGANLITQCPIRSGNSYTYKFKVVGQEGTLWWHAHSSFLRATVYGALIIRPRLGPSAYPFDKPYREIPIILGEWWKEDVIKVEKDAYLAGNIPIKSDAFTINGMPGDLYPCPYAYKLKVEYGKTYMLRIINAALNSHLFFKVAGHFFTVVAVDASYTEPCVTDTIVIAPGQTVDALMETNAAPARYYMAARAYLFLAPPLEFDDTTATAVIEYASAPPISSAPEMPPMPFYFDTPTAELFYTRLNGLVGQPGSPTVPLAVDERMLVTVGFNLLPCARDQTRCGGVALAASMNSIVFQFPKRVSLLEAHYKGVPGVYTSNFPDNPPVIFDYTKGGNPFQASKGTELKKIRYNAVVEMVLQNTAIGGFENHPMHLHGFNFFVLAQGTGNYDPRAESTSFNLVNPLVRNTIAVPAGGWAVIRFVANNPGVWFMHCHMDSHLPMGLAMAFEVENGNTPDSILPPPPPDYPKC